MARSTGAGVEPTVPVFRLISSPGIRNCLRSSSQYASSLLLYCLGSGRFAGAEASCAISRLGMARVPARPAAENMNRRRSSKRGLLKVEGRHVTTAGRASQARTRQRLHYRDILLTFRTY